jgi:hypothetical protein
MVHGIAMAIRVEPTNVPYENVFGPHLQNCGGPHDRRDLDGATLPHPLLPPPTSAPDMLHEQILDHAHFLLQ